MCGRTACTLAPEQIKKHVNTNNWENESEYAPRYNVGPTIKQPAIIQENGNRVLKSMRWGIVNKKMNSLTINARSDTLMTSGMWRDLITRKRCIVIADGYFEWKIDPKNPTKKQPYFIHLGQSKKPLMMAGLWDFTVKEDEGTKTYAYVVITTDANEEFKWLHERMPLMLNNQDQIDKWLDCDNFGYQDIVSFIKPYQVKKDDKENVLESYAVPQLVNSVKNNDKNCIARLEVFNKTGGIASFFVKKDSKANIKTEAPKEDKEVKIEVVEDWGYLPPLEDNLEGKQDEATEQPKKKVKIEK